MNNPVKKDWLRLPDLVLSDIMTVIALESITTLRICTSVGPNYSNYSTIVVISNVSECDLVTILNSVKSRVLSIRDQSLESEETQALVRAMESGVPCRRFGQIKR